MTEEELIKQATDHARAMGACGLIDDAHDVVGSINLMFKPQGREFCAAHAFPTLEQFRAMRTTAPDNRVAVDCGGGSAYNVAQLAVVGNTSMTANYTNTDVLFNLIVAHGAAVKVVAKNYAVVLITTIGKTGKIDIETDNTARILWEK